MKDIINLLVKCYSKHSFVPLYGEKKVYTGIYIIPLFSTSREGFYKELLGKNLTW